MRNKLCCQCYKCYCIVIDSGWSIINNVVLSIARYLQNGQIVDVEENGGLLEATRPMDFLPGFSLEGNLYKINIL